MKKRAAPRKVPRKIPAKKVAKKKYKNRKEDFILAFDAEWVTQTSEGDPDIKENKENHILSYQWFIICQEGKAGGIIFTEEGARWSLGRFILEALEQAKSILGFTRYPQKMTIGAHFSLADLATFADFNKNLSTKFSLVHNTFVTLKTPISIKGITSAQTKVNCECTLRDTKLLSPEGTSLEALGQLHNIPKYQTPDDYKERMDEFLKDHREAFIAYAIRDAEIVAIHLKSILEKNRQFTGNNTIPVSLGSMAIDFCEKVWKDKNYERNCILGKTEIVTTTYDKRNKKHNSKRQTEDLETIKNHRALVINCYHGGRNEAFEFGPSMEDNWIDVDLMGAYSTAMGSIGLLNYDETQVTQNINHFNYHTVGFAQIYFKFPDNCRYPGLAVRKDNMLVFPLMGMTYATAPEIRLAIDQGAIIKIIYGITVPYDENTKPFLDVVKHATLSRIAARDQEDSLGDKLYKEMINSLYGKFAQGLRDRKVLNTKTGKTEQLPESRITQPYIAAHITGIIRASLSEVMNKISTDKDIISVTTDGFITNATEEQLEELSKGPVCQILRKTREELVGNDKILETKHRVKQVLCWRTRGQATLKPHDGEDLILAKAGLNLPRAYKQKDRANEFIINLFSEREHSQQLNYEKLRGFSEIYHKGGDLTMEEYSKELGMEYDFKREPVVVEMRDYLDKGRIIWFSTKPHISVQRCTAMRSAIQRLKSEHQSCLKDTQGMDKFLSLVDAEIYLPKGQNYTSSEKHTFRTIAQAMCYNKWGLSKGDKTYSQWKVLFEEKGIKFPLDYFKKAKNRGEPLDNTIPITKENTPIIMACNQLFSSLDLDRMLTTWLPEEKEIKRALFEPSNIEE